MINARAETLATNNAFRDSFEHKRCLVPADGFYEWRAIRDDAQPFVIHRLDGAPFAFAGLWAGWKDRDDRRGPADDDDRDDRRERAHGPDPRPDAGGPRARGLGPLARPLVRGRRRAAGPPGAGAGRGPRGLSRRDARQQRPQQRPRADRSAGADPGRVPRWPEVGIETPGLFDALDARGRGPQPVR